MMPLRPMRRRRLRGSIYSFIDTASRNSPMNVMTTNDDGKGDPPPDARDHRGVLVGPVDHAADGRGVDVGEAEHRQRHLQPDRPDHVVHGGREHDRHAHRADAPAPGSRACVMPENTLVWVNSRVFRLMRHRADQPRIIGPAEAGHDQRQHQPGHACRASRNRTAPGSGAAG